MKNLLIHQTLFDSASKQPHKNALLHKDQSLSYCDLVAQITAISHALANYGIAKGDRVAVLLNKRFETAVAIYAITASGGIVVPINPLLKNHQIKHIADDCDITLLISDDRRIKQLETTRDTISVDSHLWKEWLQTEPSTSLPVLTQQATAAILYTSGSTGLSKGVVLSHRNLVLGCTSVTEYLQLSSDDVLLSVLPLSFDYGINQLFSALACGASIALLDYLLPTDVIKSIQRYGVTGLAAVPPLWQKLTNLNWPSEATSTLRYITNSGGHLASSFVRQLQQILPTTRIYLMYGLTEGFRATYLPPDLASTKADSIGKAIPYASVKVLRDNGEECSDNEIGELVQFGDLVAQGYWNNTKATEAVFKDTENGTAIWSGDRVKRDSDGYLYFISRGDQQIKTNGYRVSPNEIETTTLTISGVEIALAFGVKHPEIGQAIVLLVEGNKLNYDKLVKELATLLPRYMQPSHIEITTLLRTPNGKIDTQAAISDYRDYFL